MFKLAIEVSYKGNFGLIHASIFLSLWSIKSVYISLGHPVFSHHCVEIALFKLVYVFISNSIKSFLLNV